ncbi:hypothetical protein [Ralstonia mannitolilytica]|uniref:hypothetical protein n=1 Tax=Ralstonia mannitolilytica TaxID=105219 RepID=UPI0007AFFB16|nr:hypothetical protein [Ralstonia mannitolilytica]ANA32274.1 hypothetical protein VZ52_02055 [Ralstonia mannitolilytica]
MTLSESKLEEMLKECVPGGSLCDPQAVADNIREWFKTNIRAQADARPVAKWHRDSQGGIVITFIGDPYVVDGGELFTAPPAESAGVGLSDEEIFELWCSIPTLGGIDDDIVPFARELLSRTHAADGEAIKHETGGRMVSHITTPSGMTVRYECEDGVSHAIVEAAQQQAEPESVIKRQAQKIGELIADRDSWIEAHARLYRLYHDQSPKVGEEIHVNVEGGDVYTLPLQLSGMDKPRFVVHVPCSPQAEPGADERAAFDEAECRAKCDVCPGTAATGGDWPCAKKAAKRAAQSGQQVGDAEVQRVLNRLNSSDPDFDDCAAAAALIVRMATEMKGPDGYATWKDAAVAERRLRVASQSGQRAGTVRALLEAKKRALAFAHRESLTSGDFTKVAMYAFEQGMSAAAPTQQEGGKE